LRHDQSYVFGDSLCLSEPVRGHGARNDDSSEQLYLTRNLKVAEGIT